jgi:O-antigen ligase
LSYLIVGIGAIGFAAAATRRPGWPVLVLIALLFCLVVFPKFLSHSNLDPTHVGIAQSAPVVATYTVVLLGAAYALLLRLLYRPRPRSLPISVFVFLAFLAIGFGTIWHGSEEQVAGALQLSLGFCGWFIGAQLGPLVLAQERRVRWIAGMVLGLVGVETVVTLLQRAGVRINPMRPALAAIMGHRTNGTTNHPDNLGKVLLFLLILCLGLIATSDARARRMLWISVVLLFIPLGLSEGRANLLAALTTIVFWALLSGRRRSAAIRVGIPLVAALVILPFYGSIASRIEKDPNGGPRAGLASAAIEQIQREPWGVGPNSYVSVVSAYDAVTAAGYPVHNTFLLTAAELGILGAILFWLPVVGLLVAAWTRRRRSGFQGSFAIAILASAPGLYVVNASGWAILSGQLFPLWFLVCGIAYSQFEPAGRLAWFRPRSATTGAAFSATRLGRSRQLPVEGALPLSRTGRGLPARRRTPRVAR